MFIKLLIVDEEIPDPDELASSQDKPRPYMWYYYYALTTAEDSIDFVVARSVDEAKELLKQSPCPFDFVSLDVIMEPGESMDSEAAEGGVITGILLLQWLIDSDYDGNVILLTQRNKNTINKLLPKEIRKLRSLEVFEKMKLTPFQLVEKVQLIGRRK